MKFSSQLDKMEKLQGKSQEKQIIEERASIINLVKCIQKDRLDLRKGYLNLSIV